MFLEWINVISKRTLKQLSILQDNSYFMSQLIQSKLGYVHPIDNYLAYYLKKLIIHIKLTILTNPNIITFYLNFLHTFIYLKYPEKRESYCWFPSSCSSYNTNFLSWLYWYWNSVQNTGQVWTISQEYILKCNVSLTWPVL